MFSIYYRVRVALRTRRLNAKRAAIERGWQHDTRSMHATWGDKRDYYREMS